MKTNDYNPNLKPVPLSELEAYIKRMERIEWEKGLQEEYARQMEFQNLIGDY